MSNFYIDVSNNADGSLAEECAYETTPFRASETRTYSCPDGIGGRFVRIRFKSDKSEFLQLCEVQVQGMSEKFLLDNLENLFKWSNTRMSAKELRNLLFDHVSTEIQNKEQYFLA